MGDNNYYEARARNVDLESITSSGDNALILEKLRDDNDSIKSLNILGVDDEWDDDGHNYVVQEGDDLGWLGYFIGQSTRLESLLILIPQLPRYKSLGQGLAQNQSIQILSIWNDLEKAGFQTVAPFLQNTNTLEELKIYSSVYTLECAQNIALLFSRCQIRSLKRLVFEQNFLNGERFEVIASALRAQPQLEELFLCSIDREDAPFDQRGYAALGATMKNWGSPSLKTLVIKYSDLRDEGLLALVEGMANCVNLEHFELNGCGRQITDVGLRALSSLFQFKKFCLQSLDMRFMGIDNERMITLASGLAAVESLKSLNLPHNNISDEGLEALAVGLSNNNNLETLNLSDNRSFSAIGLRRLSDVIPTALNLRELNLRGNSINDEGLQALAVGLRRHPAIAKLDLSFNTISGEGLRALAAAELSSLRWLNLHSNAIADEALGVLVEGIENFSLEYVNLSYNNLITPSGLAVLTSIFRRESCSLKEIYLSPTIIEDREVVAFAEGLVGNESLTHFLFGCRNLTATGWAAFSTLLCDTSSVNNTYLSNHTLQRIGGYSLDGIPPSVRQYLEINLQNEYNVPICKILMSYSDLDMTPLLQWKLKLLPFVLAWFERAQSCRTYLEESILTFQRRRLSAMYQFIHGLPLLAASGFYKQTSTEGHSKKRKFDLCDK
jgi:Ran GTPase-activating protein (RanGAP) involved in mRNA processing and transport